MEAISRSLDFATASTLEAEQRQLAAPFPPRLGSCLVTRRQKCFAIKGVRQKSDP